MQLHRAPTNTHIKNKNKTKNKKNSELHFVQRQIDRQRAREICKTVWVSNNNKERDYKLTIVRAVHKDVLALKHRVLRWAVVAIRVFHSIAVQVFHSIAVQVVHSTAMPVVRSTAMPVVHSIAMPVFHSIAIPVVHSFAMPVVHSVAMPVFHSIAMPVVHSIAMLVVHSVAMLYLVGQTWRPVSGPSARKIIICAVLIGWKCSGHVIVNTIPST